MNYYKLILANRQKFVETCSNPVSITTTSDAYKLLVIYFFLVLDNLKTYYFIIYIF